MAHTPNEEKVFSISTHGGVERPSVTLRLVAELESSRFAALTRDLQGALSHSGDIEAVHAVRASEPSERSAAIPVYGQLMLSFLGTGAVRALIQCLQSYMARESTLSYELTRADGQSLKISAKNAATDQVEKLTAALESFLS